MSMVKRVSCIVYTVKVRYNVKYSSSPLLPYSRSIIATLPPMVTDSDGSKNVDLGFPVVV